MENMTQPTNPNILWYTQYETGTSSFHKEADSITCNPSCYSHEDALGKCNQNPFKYMAELTRKKENPRGQKQRGSWHSAEKMWKLMPPLPWKESLVSVIQGSGPEKEGGPEKDALSPSKEIYRLSEPLQSQPLPPSWLHRFTNRWTRKQSAHQDW